jgi:hypothetical protein
VIRATLLSLSGLLLLAACTEEAPRLNVLLITIDTLRADFVGCYGGSPARTPVADSLAAAGTLFLAAHSPTNRTLPSHASLFTSRYARSHGVHDNTDALPEGLATLAEGVGQAGWSTAAVISMTFLRFVGRGFQDVVEVTAGPRLAERTTWAATRRLDQATEPFFLWVHYFDPHWPYEPPPPYDRLWWESEPPRLSASLTAALSQRRLTGAEAAFLESQYRGEIAYTDRCVGRLLAHLRHRGVAPRTLVVLTSDHGESMMEHDLFFSHWRGLYQTLIHVPLILAGPGVPPGAKVSAPVSLVDVAPTVLSLMGLPVPPDFLGSSLFGSEVRRPIAAEEVWSEAWALRDGDHKLIRWREEVLKPPNQVAVESALGRSLTREESVLVARSAIALSDLDIPWDLPGDVEDVVAELISLCRAQGWVDSVTRENLFLLDRDSAELIDTAPSAYGTVARFDSLRAAWLEEAPSVASATHHHLTLLERARLKELGYLY